MVTEPVSLILVLCFSLVSDLSNKAELDLYSRSPMAVAVMAQSTGRSSVNVSWLITLLSAVLVYFL